MPSGRKNRGSRHRSHKQHQKQKLDEPADYGVQPNLRHGPLPDSDSSPWLMEALPPHVEGPSVLKQDAENVDSLPRAVNRKGHQEVQKALHNAMGVQFPSKRKKGAIAVFVEADAAISTPSSLDRWDGGDSRADETLSFFDSVGAESQLHEFKSSKLDFDNLDSLGNGFGSEDFKSESDGKNRKGKGRAGVESGNRAITVIETPGAGQVDAGLVDTSIRVKNKVSRRRDFPELVESEADKLTLDIDSNLPEFFKERGLGTHSVETVKTDSRKGGPAKRWDKDVSHRANDGEAQFSYASDADANFLDSDRKRGKTSDSGAVSSPMPRWMEDVSNKSRRPEGWQKLRKSEDAANSSSRDDAEASDEQHNAPGDVPQGGNEWVLQIDHRNLELEKELENRIRRRREESGDRDRWRDDDKERDVRRHHYQKEERYKDVSRRRDEKYKEEKHRQDDGQKVEKERSESRHRDENVKDSRQVEEKQKFDNDHEELSKDDKEHEEKVKVDRERDGRSLDWKQRDDKHKDDRHKDEKERDDRQEDKDARFKEEKPKDIRYRVDKSKEDKHKDDKDQQERFKEDKHKDERLRNEDHSERHKEDKDWGERFQDENEKRGRQRDKCDKPRDKDKDERSFKLKDEKLKDDKDRPDKHREEFDRDGKGKHDRKKAEKDQDDGIRIDKPQGERQKFEKQQDLREKDGRESDDRSGVVVDGDTKEKEDRVKDGKSQDHKDKDGRFKDDLGKLLKHDKVMVDRDKHVKGKDNKDKHDKQREDKSEMLYDEKFGIERTKCNDDAVERQKDIRAKDDRQKEGYHDDEKQGGDRKHEEKITEEKQREVRPIERFDVSRDDNKQNNGWNKESRHSDVDRDCSSSHDELFNQSKDLGEQVRSRSTREHDVRDRKASEKRASHEASRRASKVPKDDLQDQDKAVSFAANSGSVDQFKSEHRLKRPRDMGIVDAVTGEREYGSGFRVRARPAEGETEFRHEERVLHLSREERASPYDAPPHSPSPSLHDGSHFTSYDKSSRRNKFEISISVSSSGGTRRPRERNRHFTEHTDQGKAHYGLEEEVKSWDPRVSNRDMDDRSLSPEKNQDSQSSLTPVGSMASVQEEMSRGPIRGAAFHETVVLGREHRRFVQGGGPSKARRLDDLFRERSDWSYHSIQVNRPPMGGPMVRPQMAALTNRLSGPSGLLPPPPPFRPGIDNPTILGTPGNAFEEVPAPREGGRYDRKMGGAYKRSEMQGPGDSWRGIGMGNWNAQNQGPGPGNMFSPFPQIGAQPSGGFLGMGQQFAVPPLFGPGVGRPSADVGFGGARFHMGDGGVCFPGPNHGAAMGWHRPAEPDENFYPRPGPVDTWEGQGPFIDEQQRFGRPEWDQGGQGLTGRGWERGPPHIWQGQAGDAATGFNSSRFQRDAPYQGSLVEEIPASRQDPHNANRKGEMMEDRFLDMGDAEGSHKMLAAPFTDDVISAVTKTELKASKKARARMQMLLLNVNISAELAGNDLYNQYLSLLPQSEAKILEASAQNHRDDVSFGSTEEDFEFEPDSEALDLLSSSETRLEFLPSLPETSYKEALELYHKPVRENRVQKSVYGSFLLPVDSSLIKMPSLDVELVNIRDAMESLDEQEHFPCEIDDRDRFPVDDNIPISFLKSMRESSCEEIEVEEAEQVQDNQELILVGAGEYFDRQAVKVNSVENGEGGFTEVSLCIQQGGDIGPIMDEDEDMATGINEPGQQTFSLSIDHSLLSKSLLVETDSVLDNLPEKQLKNSKTHCNKEIPLVLNLHNASSLAAGVTPEANTAMALLVTGLETNCDTHANCTDACSPVQNVIKIDWSSRSWDDSADCHPAEHPVASQQVGEDLEDKFWVADVVGAATPALAIGGEMEELRTTLDTAGVIEIDDVRGSTRACIKVRPFQGLSDLYSLLGQSSSPMDVWYTL